MSILIGADFVPTESNKKHFSDGEISYLFGDELLSVLRSADYRIFNLETPLTDQKSPIDKVGPSLIAPTSTINAYKAIDVNMLTLANNHVMDQGLRGLMSTIRTLKEAGIAYMGVGRDIEEASRPHIFEFSQKRVGIYACAEHEFSIVNEEKAGANPFDPFDSCDHIRELKKECDYVIVLYHGGKQYYRYPSPQLQKRCRKMVDAGANLVICQHSHCIGCEEDMESGKIVYGQGNFLFDDSDKECWKTGMLVEITDQFDVSYIPVIKKENTVRLAGTEEKGKILREFENRSKEILSDDFVYMRYSQLADETLMKYLYVLQGKESVLFRILNKLSRNRIREKRLKHLYGNKQCRAIRNSIECEAHHELLLQALKNRS